MRPLVVLPFPHPTRVMAQAQTSRGVSWPDDK